MVGLLVEGIVCFNTGRSGVARPSGFILGTIIGFRVFMGSNFLSDFVGPTS